MNVFVNEISGKYIRSKLLSNLDIIVDNYEIKWNIGNYKNSRSIRSSVLSTRILQGNFMQVIHWSMQLHLSNGKQMPRLYEISLICQFDEDNVAPNEVQVTLESLACNGNSLEKNTSKIVFRQNGLQRLCLISQEELDKMSDKIANNCYDLTITCDLTISETMFDDSHLDSESISKLRCMFNKELFSDARIIVGLGTFFVHKIVLSMRSNIFFPVLSHKIIETIENEVRIADFDYKTVEDMLKFIYHLEPVEISLDLLAIASKYNVKLLKKLCERTLGHKITEDNVIVTLKAAHQYQAEDLKGFAFYFLLNKYWYCRGTLEQQIRELSKDVIVELLTEISGHIAPLPYDTI